MKVHLMNSLAQEMASKYGALVGDEEGGSLRDIRRLIAEVERLQMQLVLLIGTGEGEVEPLVQ